MLAGVNAQFGRSLGGAVFMLLLVLGVWTAYANVFSDDAPVRAQGEALAREHAGCKDCKLVRVEGGRGMIHTTLTYSFERGSQVRVKCRRKYISFGDYECTATKP